MLVRWWAVVAVLMGCAASRPTRPPGEQPPTEAEEEAADPELWAVADAVDPGPQKPLFDALPAWLRARVGAAPDGAVAVKEIREALMAWEKLRPTGGQDFLMALLHVGRGLVLAEQAVAGGVDDPELLLALTRAYAILSNPAFADEQGLFQQILQFGAAMLTKTQQPGDGAVEVAAVVNGLREVFKRAPLLHRRTAAELLRRHGDHPEVPRVLARLADDDGWNERFHGALKLRKMALARLGPRATGADHLDMASTCYRALEPACGDEALAQGRKLGADKPDAKAVTAFAERVKRVEEQATQARRVQALAADPRVKDPAQADLGPGLERGHLLVLLGRYDDARAQFEALKAAHPGDARPFAGLAKVAVADGGNLAGGAAMVEAGRRLANRDRGFYEVALGVLGAKLMTEVLPQVMQGGDIQPQAVMKGLLDDMREYAGGLQAFEPARAGVVLALEAVARVGVPLFDAKDPAAGQKLTAEVLRHTRALAGRFPESPDVRRMMFLAANFADDVGTALALAAAPLPGPLASDVAMQRTRLQVWLEVAVDWERPEELEKLRGAVLGLQTAANDWGVRQQLALVLGVKFMAQQDRAAAAEAAQLFDALAQDAEVPAESQVAALVNAGALYAGLGDVELGKKRFEEAVERDPKSMPALVNLAALYTTHGVHEPKLAEIFEVAAQDSAMTGLRLQAAAWRYTQAKAGLGDVEVTRKAFLERLDAARTSDPRGSTPLGRWAVSRGTWNMSMQYQASTGFEILNTISTTTWLVLPSPDLDELIRSAPGKADGKRAKPAKQPTK